MSPRLIGYAEPYIFFERSKSMSKNEFRGRVRKLTVFNGSFPHLICPSCERGHIHRPEKILKIETGESKRAKGHDAWEPDWVWYAWSGIGICSNKECAQTFSLGGEAHEKFMGNWDELVTEYVIKNIFPSPMLFNIPSNYPEKAKEELLNSFGLFFCNPSASANVLRASMESFLDDLKIRKTFVKNHKRKHLTLGSRIKDYLSRSKYSSISSYVEAIKWIGNSGSHDSSLTAENVLQAYDFLEIILGDLSLKSKTQKAKKSVNEINRRKRPVL